MLKRSKLLVALLVVTVLCASIGFAAVSDTLTANGNWSMVLDNTDPDNPFQEAFDEQVYFSAVSVKADGTTVADSSKVTFSDVSTANTDELTITIADGVFTQVGEVLIVEAIITNASTAQNAAVAVGELNDANIEAYASISANVSNATVAANNGTVTLTITITLNKIPANDLSNVEFSVPVTAEALN